MDQRCGIVLIQGTDRALHSWLRACRVIFAELGCDATRDRSVPRAVRALNDIAKEDSPSPNSAANQAKAPTPPPQRASCSKLAAEASRTTKLFGIANLPSWCSRLLSPPN